MPPYITAPDLLQRLTQEGARWSHDGTQMTVNVVHWEPGSGVPTHVNAGLDVWIVVIGGEGEAVVDGETIPLTPATCLYIPAGSERAIRATVAPLLYTTAHLKRGPLLPA